MDNKSLSLASALVTPGYIQSGSEALNHHYRDVRSILAQRRCPEVGLSDLLIEHLLLQLAMMDSNNFPGHIGAGEREGRVASGLVRRRHFGLLHGVGRSGDLNSDQPKAAGSSLLFQIANLLVLDILHESGYKYAEKAVVVPMATGMTLALALGTLRKQAEQDQEKQEKEQVQVQEDREGETHSSSNECKRNGSLKRYVVWPRVDQKTALKCIDAAGLKAVPVELRHAPMQAPVHHGKRRGISVGKEEDALHPYLLQVHVDDIRAAIESVGGPNHVLCVLSTTSCFAPRVPDDVLAVSRLCKELDIAYVINNAYGMQSKPIMTRIDSAARLGRVDYVVQSGDKNFLVPVGGSVLAGSQRNVDAASAAYAGRASATPAIDLFITCLELGRSGFKEMWENRIRVRRRLAAALSAFAEARGEELVEGMIPTVSHKEKEQTQVGKDGEIIRVIALEKENEEKEGEDYYDVRNTISFAMTMRHVKDPSALGAKLFRYRGVTGPRVLAPSLPALQQQLSPSLSPSTTEGTEGKPNTNTTIDAAASVSTTKKICGHVFRNYGCHCNEPPCAMLVMACGIGMEGNEVDELITRLDALWPVPIPSDVSAS